MDPGYVYILSNAAMPGLLKIGMTTRHPRDRVMELSGATGVPIAFEVLWYMPVSNARAAEAEAHRTLDRYRLSGNREFFQVDPDFAISELTYVLASYHVKYVHMSATSGVLKGIAFLGLFLVATAFVGVASVSSRLAQRYWFSLPDYLGAPVKACLTAAFLIVAIVLVVLIRDFAL